MAHIIAKRGILLLLLFTVLGEIICSAQITDSTMDVQLSNTCLSELISIKHCFDYNDTNGLIVNLSLKGYTKDEPSGKLYKNTRLDQTLEFCKTPIRDIPTKLSYYNKNVLLFRGYTQEFKDMLEGLVRQLKYNENLSVDEYKDELMIGFFDHDLQYKFLISLHEKNYCLILL